MSKKIKRPSNFKLLSETIDIRYVDGLLKRTGSLGQAHNTYNELWIDDGSSYDKEILEAILYHELFHMALDKMGEYELSANEKFVNIASGLILQAIKSIEEKEE